MQLTQNHIDYWHKNLRLTAILLVIWFIATFVLAWYAIPLAEMKMFGWPFSFYMAAQAVPNGGVQALCLRQNPDLAETVDSACLRTRHYSGMMLTILRLLLLIPTALRLRSELRSKTSPSAGSLPF